MHEQRTIKAPVEIQGVGLHCGKDVKITIQPAEVESGIRFIRSDLNKLVEIPAHVENIRKTLNASTLGINGISIGTVEHLMAAFYGLGIDNARVEVDGPEVPILDGSAQGYISGLHRVGVKRQKRFKRFILIRRPVAVKEDGKFAELHPAEELRIKCTISYDHPLLSYQSYEFNFSESDFEKEIAPARTFGFLHELDWLRKNGLAKGGSLENAIIIGKQSILNPGLMHYHDEFVRHKILDTLGDLMLLGGPVIGRFIGFRSGHTLNLKLVKTLLENPDNYEVIEAYPPEAAKQNGFKTPRWITPPSPAS